jgi:REP element-mobilizing transposase RayT
MPQSLAALYTHIVFSTMGREPLIDEGLEQRLYDYIGGIIRERKGVLLSAGGVADHVHLLVSMGREWAVSDLVRDIKSNSSGWVHDTFPELAHFFWQAGYGAFSVSASQLPVIRGYIARQKEHHAGQSFQDEYRQILTEHGLEWDERYVWD